MDVTFYSTMESTAVDEILFHYIRLHETVNVQLMKCALAGSGS